MEQAQKELSLKEDSLQWAIYQWVEPFIIIISYPFVFLLYVDKSPWKNRIFQV